MTNATTMLSDKRSTHRDSTQATSSSQRLGVLVVDDHQVVLWGFRLLLTAQSWVQRYLSANEPEEAIALARRYEPQVALVDMFLGEQYGGDLCKRLEEASPITKVLLMSGVGQLNTSSARGLGAYGFVPKSWDVQEIANAVRLVGLGRTVFAPVESNPPNRLSEREQQVLALIADGSTNREIAERLFLSTHTVKDHTRTLYRKLGARSRADAIARAHRIGLLG